mgnify:CR=1 FL=1
MLAEVDQGNRTPVGFAGTVGLEVRLTGLQGGSEGLADQLEVLVTVELEMLLWAEE